MCAQFVTIGSVLAERNLAVPVLRCLKPDGAFYETLAIQSLQRPATKAIGLVFRP
jgi:hypothetical protein